MADDGRGARSAAWGVLAVVFGGGAIPLWLAVPGGPLIVLIAACIVTVIGAAGVYMCFASLSGTWPASRSLRPGAPPATPVTPTATTTTGPAQAVAGNNNILISDVRDSTFHITTGPDGSKPLTHPMPDGPVTVGEVPQQPPAFQARDDLLVPLRQPTPEPGTCVIHAITGMPGTGKTQLAAACARHGIEDKWRLVAWINADNAATTLNGLTQAATTLGIPPGDDQETTARALRHFLETHGQQCLLVFDNAPNPDALRPYLPAAGDAHIIITSTRQSVASLGIPVAVDVFTVPQALTYLHQRTGIVDDNGARELAAELGHLPLALAQAAAVIRTQRISYPTYLERLRAFPVDQYLIRTEEDPYPHAAAAAILLALHTAYDTDSTGLAGPVMSLIALLSPSGVPRNLLQTAAASGALNPVGRLQPQHHAGALGPAQIDAVLAHLAGASLLTFSLDGSGERRSAQAGGTAGNRHTACYRGTARQDGGGHSNGGAPRHMGTPRRAGQPGLGGT